jgi:hypothetical protein
MKGLEVSVNVTDKSLSHLASFWLLRASQAKDRRSSEVVEAMGIR